MAKPENIIEALEFQGELTHAYYDRQTGSVVVLTDDELAAAEDDDIDNGDHDAELEHDPRGP